MAQRKPGKAQVEIMRHINEVITSRMSTTSYWRYDLETTIPRKSIESLESRGLIASHELDSAYLGWRLTAAGENILKDM